MKKQGKVGTNATKTKEKKCPTETNISIWGRSNDIDWGKITNAQAKKIIKSGITKDDLDGLLCNSESLLSDVIEAEVNGIQVTCEIPTNRAKATRFGNSKSWLIVRTQGTKEIRGGVVSGERFDPTKLRFVPSRYSIGNTIILSGFSVSYDGTEIEFQWSDIKSEGWAIYSPQGKEFKFDIVSDDDMEGESGGRSFSSRPG